MTGLIKATYVYIVSMCMGSVLTSGREGQYGQKKTSQWFFLNFIDIVLWDVPNKRSKFENRFPGLF